MRVLVVEDDPVAVKLIEKALAPRRCIVEKAETGDDALGLIKLYDFDIMILDLGLPDGNGADVIRRLRAGQIRVPVLVLSAIGEQTAKVESLVAGADDYLTKPFDREELGARVQAIVRRAKGHAASVIRVGRMTIDLDARSVHIDDQQLHVTAKEYSILELLSLRKGMTLTKETFLDHLYGGMDEPEQKIIDVFICKLRKKIQAVTGDHHNIETVWGRGYMLREPTLAETGLAEEPRNWEQQQPDPSLSELDRLVLTLLPNSEAA